MESVPLLVTSLVAGLTDRNVLSYDQADKGRTLTSSPLSQIAKTLRNLRSFLLTPKMMQRSIRLGWSKVVGSGSNLVANDH